MNLTKSFTKPTFQTSLKPERFCINDMSSRGLKELKKKDSFLYFSIPQVWRASVLHKREASSEENEDGQVQQVVRQTRLSTECHPDLLLEEFFRQESSTSLQVDQFSDDNKEGCSNRNSDEDDVFLDDLFLSFFNMTVGANESRKRKNHPQ